MSIAEQVAKATSVLRGYKTLAPPRTLDADEEIFATPMSTPTSSEDEDSDYDEVDWDPDGTTAF